MPFKSQAQRGKFYAMADRGEISKATVRHWEDATPKGKKLPEHVAHKKEGAFYHTGVTQALAEFGMAEKNAFEKNAIRALTRYLMDKAPEEAAAVIRRLAPNAQAEQAYKLLGNKARQGVMRGMEEGAGHGQGHVWDVAKETQENLLGKPTGASTATVTRPASFYRPEATGFAASPAAASFKDTEAYRRGTLGALLHDMGRSPELQQMKNLQQKYVRESVPVGGQLSFDDLARGKSVGKKTFQNDPRFASQQHAEIGGAYVRDFLHKNRALTREVPGVDARVRNLVRAHDISTQKFHPWTQNVMPNDRAAGGAIFADKAQGLGSKGWGRTEETGRAFGETPQQTYEFATKKNVPMYTDTINRFAPTPDIGRRKMNDLRQYHVDANAFAQTHGLPQVPLQDYNYTGAGSIYRKAASVKEAMAVEEFVSVFKKLLQRLLTPAEARAAIAKISEGNIWAKGEALKAAYNIPPEERMKVLQFLMEK